MSRVLIYLLLGCDPFKLAQVRAAIMQINVLQDAFHTVLIIGLGHCNSSLEILYTGFFCLSDGHQ